MSGAFYLGKRRSETVSPLISYSPPFPLPTQRELKDDCRLMHAVLIFFSSQFLFLESTQD